MNPRTPQDPRHQLPLGKAIRALRRARKESLESLAEKAGITRNMLSLIERGEGNPSWLTVKGIATALDISIVELAEFVERHEDSADPN